MIRIDGLKFKEMLQGGAKALEMNRAIVDELNVFPVPDGDTGTNMSMTLASAVREANACESLLIDEIALAFSKGAFAAQEATRALSLRKFSEALPLLSKGRRTSMQRLLPNA